MQLSIDQSSESETAESCVSFPETRACDEAVAIHLLTSALGECATSPDQYGHMFSESSGGSPALAAS